MWCDFCGRTRSADTLPEDTSIRDIGGELICEDCDTANITTIGIYPAQNKPGRSELVVGYYRGTDPHSTITFGDETLTLTDEITFSDGRTAKQAYEEVQSVKGPARVVVDANHDNE